MDANINIDWVLAAVNRHQPSAMREPIHREKREYSARMIKYGRKECSGWNWDGGARQGLAPKTPNSHSEMRKTPFDGGWPLTDPPIRRFNYPSLRYLTVPARTSRLKRNFGMRPFGVLCAQSIINLSTRICFERNMLINAKKINFTLIILGISN